MAWAESRGLSAVWIGQLFMLFTILLYTGIGLMSRTSDLAEYYVAGRRIPALFNGMAIGADWMSAASFIGLAGTLFLLGFQGLAFVVGWTGGYVLVALLLAPYLRRFGEYTIPDFLGARYESNAVRVMAVIATIIASFVYVVAQIYGVGVIVSRFGGLQFEVGIFIGLAGVLICSFLGGMRAVTWTQVAQYFIIITAYLVPLIILSFKLTGNPFPYFAYGSVIEPLSRLEQRVQEDPAEQAARAHFHVRAEHYAKLIAALPESLRMERTRLEQEVLRLKQTRASQRAVVLAEKERANLPTHPELARSYWENARKEALERAKTPVGFTSPFADNSQSLNAGETKTGREGERANFLALVFCLTLGTAALPHVLIRFYTTSSVREARNSVSWAILFILLLYLAAPAYAAFVKFELLNKLVGIAVTDLPGWFSAWKKIGLVRFEDINGDSLVQWAEITINPDAIILATPELAGLPYVISGLVAAGALAAALSTADGLLLTISSALSHDVYYRLLNPKASLQWRLVISKFMLLVVAVIAAMVAAQRPATILDMVAWAFSIAASAFFPVLVLGIFWRRGNKAGALAGMVTGLSVTMYYMVRLEFENIDWLGLYGIRMEPWFGIESVSAGVFGVPAGTLAYVVVCLLTPPPNASAIRLVDRLRSPA